jgi:hypothetical protein
MTYHVRKISLITCQVVSGSSRVMSGCRVGIFVRAQPVTLPDRFRLRFLCVFIGFCQVCLSENFGSRMNPSHVRFESDWVFSSGLGWVYRVELLMIRFSYWRNEGAVGAIAPQ